MPSVNPTEMMLRSAAKEVSFLTIAPSRLAFVIGIAKRKGFRKKIDKKLIKMGVFYSGKSLEHKRWWVGVLPRRKG